MVWTGWLRRRRPASRRRRRADPRADLYLPGLTLRRLEPRRVLSVTVIDAQAFTVAENTPAGTVVGTVQVDTAGQPTPPVKFSIANAQASDPFTIDQNSGELKVQNAAALDFETTPVFQVEVVASQAGPNPSTDSGTVTVNLSNVYAAFQTSFSGPTATLALTGGRIELTHGGQTFFSTPAEDVASLSILGSSQNNTLNVNMAGGNPLPTGGLVFDGLTQPNPGGDALVILGGAFQRTTYTYANAHDGSILLDTGAWQRTIEFRGLEPVTNTGTVADAEFILPATDDHAVLEDIGGGQLRLRSATGTFETTTFTIPTGSVTVRGGDGADRIEVAPLAGAFTVTIDGGAGSNTLVVDQRDPTLAAPLFRFAGFTFDQTDTPDLAAALAGTPAGSMGVTLTTTPGPATGAVNFPESAAGFTTALSVGRLLNPALTGARALNLPLGNNGTTARAGIELTWSVGRTLSNQPGRDFVFYESADDAGGPDGAMVQVRVAGGAWTRWFYRPAEAFATYTGSTVGAFVTSFDLSDFGLGAGVAIDAIRYVNLTAADRIDGPGVERVPGSGALVGQGFVLPGDNGATSSVRPDPGPLALFSFYGSATFDPDPLYVGVLHPLAGPAVSSGQDVVTIDATTVGITRDAVAQPTINYTAFAALEARTRSAVDELRVRAGGGPLPASILLDGGSPGSGDRAVLESLSGAESFVLRGNRVTVGGTTVTLSDIEELRFDLAAAGAGDTVTIQGPPALGGTAPRIDVAGGAGQTDQLIVQTEVAPTTPAAQLFSFAGVTFDQTATPNVFSELGPGTFSGAVVNTRPSVVNNLTGFPNTLVGFDISLTMGRLLGRSTGATVQAFGLPDSTNVGTTLRGGYVVRWSEGRVLANEPGADLVLYESGSANQPEPQMVQVHDPVTDTWSPWVYLPASSFGTFAGGGGFATLYDLSDFGLAAGAVIDAVRVTNLVAADRMVSATRTGIVIPNDGGATSTFLPLPGPLASFGSFGASTLDPDPLYLGALHQTTTAAATADDVAIDADSVDVVGWAAIGYTNLDRVTVETGGGADRVAVTPTVATAIHVDAGTPGFAVNPGDRVTLRLVGAVDPLLTVTGIGAGTLTTTGNRNATFVGVDHFDATAAYDLSFSSAANPVAGPDDLLRAVRESNDLRLDVNGAQVFRGRLAAIDDLTAVGTADNDRLTLDFAGGSPIPAGGVTFDAAAAGTDELYFVNGTVGTVDYDFTAIGNGQALVGGQTVDFTGVDAIEDTLAAGTRRLDYLATDNTLTLDDHPTAGLSQLTSDHAPTVRFANPSTLLDLRAGPGNDQVFVRGLDAGFAASVAIQGQTGDDTFRVDSAGPATGGTVDFVRWPLDIDGGGQAGDRLIVDDRADTTGDTFTIGATRIGSGPVVPPNPLFGAGGVLTYSTVARLDVLSGSGADDVTFAAAAVPPPGPNPSRLLTLQTGAGQDAIRFTSLEANFRAALEIDGGADADTLDVNTPLTLGSAVSTGNVDFTAEEITLAAALNTTAGTVGAVTLNAATRLTMTAAGDVTTGGAFLQTGPLVHTAADVTTTGDPLTFQGAVLLTGNAALSTGAGPGNVALQSTVNGDHRLEITAGAGTVDVTGTVGGTTPLSGLVVHSAASAFFHAAVSVDDEGLAVTTSGALDFTGPVASTAGGAVTLTNGGTLTLPAAADFLLDGSFVQNGAGAVQTAANVTTTGDLVSWAGNVTLTGSVEISTGTGAGDVRFLAQLNAAAAGAQDLRITAGTGDVRFAGLVGNVAPLGDVTIVSADDVDVLAAFAARTLTQQAGSGTTTLAGAVTLSATTGTGLDLTAALLDLRAAATTAGAHARLVIDDLVLDPALGSLDVTAAGIVTIVTRTPGRAIDLGTNTAGRLAITDAELDRITAGTLRIGSGASGPIDVSAVVSPGGTGILHLTTGAGIGGAGSLIETALALEAVGPIALAGPNDVGTLAAVVTGAGQPLAFRDTGDLEIGTVDGVVGLVLAGGAATLDVAGGLTQSAAGSITAEGLELLSATSVILTLPTNDVATLAGNVTGPVEYRDANALTIGTVNTVGLTTTNDAVRLRSGGTLLLVDSIQVGAALVALRADAGGIDDGGSPAAKVVASSLVLRSTGGVGNTNPLRTTVATVAGANVGAGGWRVVNAGVPTFTVGVVDGLAGLVNAAGGGIALTQTGALNVVQPVVDPAGGSIELTTVADGGADDHLTLSALVAATGGSGGAAFTAGTDLRFLDTGLADDAVTQATGVIRGLAGRDVTIGPDVRLRSGTGAITALPPRLENLTGPQVQNTGQAQVTFDYGRLLEQGFTAFVDWSDGTVDALPRVLPDTLTAFHVYIGNPNPADPSAPILVTVTLRLDDHIDFPGYNTTTLTVTLGVPGEGLVPGVRIDTTPKVPELVAPTAVLVSAAEVPRATLITTTQVLGSGAGVSQAAVVGERYLLLREVLPDGREGDEARLDERLLTRLAELFQRLPDGRYRLYRVEDDGRTARLVMDVVLRGGRPAAPGELDGGGRDRPPGDDAPLDPSAPQTPTTPQSSNLPPADGAATAANPAADSEPGDEPQPAGPRSLGAAGAAAAASGAVGLAATARALDTDPLARRATDRERAVASYRPASRWRRRGLGPNRPR